MRSFNVCAMKKKERNVSILETCITSQPRLADAIVIGQSIVKLVSRFKPVSDYALEIKIEE